MPYPPTPWYLEGYAVQTLHLVDIDRIRHLIPSELKIISVFPGKTIGGLYLSKYISNSVLAYSELIIIPALVSYRGKISGWVSHIYVDNLDSVAGGREIWGLPKELADFDWQIDKRVVVKQGNNLLCRLDYNKQSLFAWRQWLAWSSLSRKNGNILSFPFEFEFKFGLINSRLEVPQESHFSDLNLQNPLLTIRCDEMSLKVDAPVVI
ncbi:MAG: acetoacetate decarboxylase family protein [Methylacidiphilales bacterium]|nr:acetoacetate decarboxylase family protein [Candidatus Methylacidiphilales bacterium]NJR16581.1 acetoacetate decarboxylase family protein [Calothrix sp. CSU_2_0]